MQPTQVQTSRWQTLTQHRWFGGLLVLVGAILYSSKAIFVKLSYQVTDIESVPLLALRMGFALPIYLTFALRAKAPKDIATPPTWRDHLALFLTGLSGYYLASLFDFIGLKYVSAGIERLILFSYPTLVLLLSWIWLKKPIRGIHLLALFLTYSGIALVMQGDTQIADSKSLWIGGGWVFLAALFYAIYLVANERLIPKYGSIRFTSLSMLGAASVVIIQAFAMGYGDLWHYPLEIYAYTFSMAVIATVIPSFLIVEGIKRIGAHNTAIIGSIGPVSTILLAYLFLGEVLSPLQMVGTAVVMAGVLSITLRKKA
ncbi:DMT family transporter [Pontibacter sp. G13]|uniref:DMT family transporter n=1 Tax=Pontibacter sp. G13 TaxID=3074898 RepID=UPI00288AF087|nr:DMT family transporter [Pontibacter sp. G13]WNJ21265.1 DMT family transporter [Pontibacter sp. G13]